MEERDNLDYYKILQSEKSDSLEIIKKNYQRLVLSHHPDKTVENESQTFLIIQKAWSIMRNPESRKQYDALLACYENCDILLYNTIPLSDMDYNSDNDVYSYECRCSGIYYVEKCELTIPSVTISCNECSFSILVNVPDTN